MWLLSIIPEFFVHLILVVGLLGTILGFVLTFIPFVNQYKLPIQLISIIVLSLGLFLEGGLSNEHIWKVRTLELEVKLAKAEAKSEKVNTVVVTKYLTKKQVIKEKSDEIVKYIDREITKYDKSCPIPEQAVRAHNAAAANDIMLLVPPDEVSAGPVLKASPGLKLAPRK